MNDSGKALNRRADIVSFGDQDFTDITADRGFDFGIVQIDLSQRQIGFSLFNG